MAGGPCQPRVLRWPAAVAGSLGIRLKTHWLWIKQPAHGSQDQVSSGLSGSDTNRRFQLKEVCVDVVMMCGDRSADSNTDLRRGLE